MLQMFMEQANQMGILWFCVSNVMLNMRKTFFTHKTYQENPGSSKMCSLKDRHGANVCLTGSSWDEGMY